MVQVNLAFLTQKMIDGDAASQILIKLLKEMEINEPKKADVKIQTEWSLIFLEKQASTD